MEDCGGCKKDAGCGKIGGGLMEESGRVEEGGRVEESGLDGSGSSVEVDGRDGGS